MGVRVKFKKNGIESVVSIKVAEILEKRAEIDIVEIEEKAPADLQLEGEGGEKKTRRGGK